jgi:hypothetical protein
MLNSMMRFAILLYFFFNSYITIQIFFTHAVLTECHGVLPLLLHVCVIPGSYP